MKVNELLSFPVSTITLDSDVGQARDIMKLKKISALPVVSVEGEKVIVEGIVSVHDMAGVYDDNVPIKQVVSRKIFAVTPGTSIKKAAEVMLEKKVHHLIVLDGEELVGIVSALDYVKLVADSQYEGVY